jgi:hypothetical protein
MRNSMRRSSGTPGCARPWRSVFDRPAHGLDRATELDDRPIAGALDDAAGMGVDRGIDQIAAEAPQARERALFVGAGEPAIADEIGDQDRRELPGLAHCLALVARD